MATAEDQVKKQAGEALAQIPAIPEVGQTGVFASMQNFQDAQRIARALASSTLVPKEYQGEENLGNTLIALEMAQRVGASPLMVMQNLDVIHGRPSWSAKFVIAALNSCGRFSPLRFEMEDLGEKEVAYEITEYRWDPQERRKKKQISRGTVKIHDRRCRAWTYDRRNGEKLTGPEVTIEMAVREGWYVKDGSKWKTMPDLMLHYRAAAFLGRLYAPDVLMGMQTTEEIEDFIDVDPRTGEIIREGTGETAAGPTGGEPEKPKGRVDSVKDRMRRQREASRQGGNGPEAAGERAGGEQGRTAGESGTDAPENAGDGFSLEGGAEPETKPEPDKPEAESGWNYEPLLQAIEQAKTPEDLSTCKDGSRALWGDLAPRQKGKLKQAIGEAEKRLAAAAEPKPEDAGDGGDPPVSLDQILGIVRISEDEDSLLEAEDMARDLPEKEAEQVWAATAERRKALGLSRA